MAIDPNVMASLFGSDSERITTSGAGVNLPPEPTLNEPDEAKNLSLLDRAIDVGKGIISGVPKEAENLVQTGHDIINFADDKLLGDRFVNNETDVDYVPDALKPKTGLGKTAQTISAFATGWLTAGRWVTSGVGGIKTISALAKSAPKSMQFVNAAISGGVVDLISGDASDTRLADTLLENDVMNNAVVRYLATNEDDSAAEARFKNVLEGFMLITSLEAAGYVFKSIKNGVKQSMKGDLNGAMKARLTARDEWYRLNGENMDITSTLTYTDEAQAKLVRQALREGNLADMAAKAKKFNGGGVNPETFIDQTTKQFVSNMDKPIAEYVADGHVVLADYRKDALDRIVRAGGDKIFDYDALKHQLTDADARVKVATLHMYMDTTFGQQLDIATQNLKEGMADAIPNIRNLYTRGTEILCDLKKMNMEAGQTLNMNKLSRVTGEPTGKGVLSSLPTDSLAFAKETASQMTDDELRLFAQTMKEVKANGGEDMVTLMLASLKAGNPLRKLAKDANSPIMDSILKYRYIAMLSSFKTQARNIIGNSMKLALMPIEEGVQGMVRGGMQGYASGGLSGMGVGALRGVKEGAYYLQGLQYAFRHSREHAALAWDYGRAFSRIGEFSNLSGKAIDTPSVARNIYEAPLRGLSAMDEFFSTLAGGAKIYQRAVQDLNKSHVLDNVADKVLKSDITAKWLDDAYTKGFSSIVLDDGRVIEKGAFAVKEALEVANEVTFQQHLEGFTKSLADLTQKYPPLKILFPFVKTPVNLFKDVFWTRGLDAPMALARAIQSKNPEEVTKAAAHLVSAISIWTIAGELVAQGKITGLGPKDKDQRAALMQNGWQPSSFRMADGSYIKLASVEPFGSAAEILATIAEQGERGGADSVPEWLDVTWNSLLKFTADRTYLKGLSGLLNDIDRGRTLEGNGTPTQVLLSFIPNAFTDIGRSMDDTIYEARTMVEKIQNKLGISETLSPKVAWVTGQPILYGHGGGLGAFSPINKTEDRGSLVFSELSRVGGISDPPKKIGNVELSAAEYASLCRTTGTIELHGKTLYGSLEELIESDWYDVTRMNNPDPTDYELAEHRNEAVKQVIKQYQDAAKVAFLKERPYIINPDPQFKASEMGGGLETYTRF